MWILEFDNSNWLQSVLCSWHSSPRLENSASRACSLGSHQLLSISNKACMSDIQQWLSIRRSHLSSGLCTCLGKKKARQSTTIIYFKFWDGWRGQVSLLTERNASICNWNSMNFFRPVADETWVHPDLDKISAIEQLNPPTTVTKLCRFLGMASLISQVCSQLHGRKSLNDCSCQETWCSVFP